MVMSFAHHHFCLWQVQIETKKWNTCSPHFWRPDQWCCVSKVCVCVCCVYRRSIMIDCTWIQSRKSLTTTLTCHVTWYPAHVWHHVQVELNDGFRFNLVFCVKRIRGFWAFSAGAPGCSAPVGESRACFTTFSRSCSNVWNLICRNDV